MTKKVGLVTCYFKQNYGSMLQAYATQRVLDDNNIPNETINIESNIDFSKGKKKYYLSQITNFKFIKSKLGMIKLKLDKKTHKQLGLNIKIRNKKYEEFKKEHFKLTTAHTTYAELTKLCEDRYSDVIVGSDQLWLPVNVVSNYYTLNFVPESINKISYSTSFGISNIDNKYNNLYKIFLDRINHLSVREESGVKLVEKLSNNKAKLVCDPTLLLTKEEWNTIVSKDRIIKEKYILCYFLGNNINHRKFAEKLKEKTGYKIVSLNHADEYVKYSDKFADITPYDIGPSEWLNLIKNAEYICTDSFHGTVFSLIYNKIFFTFRRHNTKNTMSTNSRIDTLLNLSGINTNRILTGNEDIADVLKLKIDYSKVNHNIEKIRNESKQWLLDSLTYKHEEEPKYITIGDKSMCSGCTACASICPKGAIKMVRDNEGFLYPQIDKNKCIECGLCKRTCPILNKQEKRPFTQKAYLFQNNNENIRADSTSGGFFSALGEYIINNHGIVYGASFNKDFIVEHTKATKIYELNKFRKSKYVQSNQNNCFEEIKQYLNAGTLVCYSGTPCQVAGLKAFLKKDYKNLITVDLMCHSVPSPLFFEKYKQYILQKLNATKILNINFRDKSKYGYKYSMMTVKTDNGTYSEGIDTDPYLRGFFGDLTVRPSCFNCQFKTQQRVSDITIWDCFNINELDRKLDDDKGTTRILIQSQKGQDIINNLQNVILKEIPVEKAVDKVKEMTHSVKYNNKRHNFFDNINDDNFIEQKFPKNIKTKINSFVRKALSVTGLYSITKSITKKILKR